MKKIAEKVLAALCSAALITALIPAFGVSAAAKTTKFLDPLDDSKFPMAYSVETVLPPNYDTTEEKILANGGVFGSHTNKPALAAFMTNKTMRLFKEVYGDDYKRTNVLMKNYIACEQTLTYEFKNGFKDFEFMGIAGAGFWAGAWGKEGVVEFSYADRLDGKWTVLDYDKIRDMPAGEASTYCYFRSEIPTSARYLRIKFLNGGKWDEQKQAWLETYENWTCVLGYLLVNQYTEPQNTNNNGGTASKPSSSSQNTSSGGAVSSGSSGSEITSGNNTSSDNTVSDSSAGELTDDELINKYAKGDGDYYVVTSREINWEITGIIIACDVLAVGGVITVLILLYRKKIKELEK